MIYLYPVVLVSGILTSLSPCVLPILPIILGVGIDGKKSRVYGLITGIVASFSFFAITLSSLITKLNISADSLRLVAATSLTLFGLALLLPNAWSKIQGKIEAVFHPPQNLSLDGGFASGLFTGIILGFVWTPCIGPIIATVITLASIQQASFALVSLVLIYSIGIGIPLLIFAEGGVSLSKRLGWYKENQLKLRKIFGAIIVFTGLMVGTGLERGFQSWVLDNIPSAISNPVEQFENRFDFDSQIKTMNEKSENEVVNKVVLNLNDLKIPEDELLKGCRGIDCIPSIDKPKFVNIKEADEWLENSDRVFVLTVDGITKVYPQIIMNRHEIVNDWFGDKAIAVTFCPLCGSATAFERKVNNTNTQFGVSGRLHNSDLVMYDRLEGNLWQQITGEAISGEAGKRNEVLEPLFLLTFDWSQAKEKYPNSEVLSTDTGFRINYRFYPYGTYEENNEIYFSINNEDKRFHPKEWFYGIEVNGQAKAYQETKILEINKVTDQVGDTKIEIENDKGEIRFKNLETDKEIVPLRVFWFAWASFHPETEIY